MKAAAIEGRIERVLIEKKRKNPHTGEMEVYERLEINASELQDVEAADGEAASPESAPCL